jgi:hypothetical protein
MCSTLLNACSGDATKCIAKKIPVINCNAKQNNARTPKFQKYDKVAGGL